MATCRIIHVGADWKEWSGWDEPGKGQVQLQRRFLSAEMVRVCPNGCIVNMAVPSPQVEQLLIRGKCNTPVGAGEETLESCDSPSQSNQGEAGKCQERWAVCELLKGSTQPHKLVQLQFWPLVKCWCMSQYHKQKQSCIRPLWSVRLHDSYGKIQEGNVAT